MKKNSCLFLFESAANSIGTINSYYGWEGDILGLYNYYLGYKKSADIIYQELKEASLKKEIEKTDTLIFPLIYLYRQALELYLKFLYFKYSHIEGTGLKKILNKNHDLKAIWSELKPILEFNLNEQQSNMDLLFIENYINQYSNYDPLSMRMRYPITKQLKLSNNKSCILDVENFNKQVNILFNYLLQVDNEIDYRISYIDVSNEKIKNFEIEKLLSKYSNKVEEYMIYLKELSNEYNPEMLKYYLSGLNYEAVVLIMLFMYSGRDIKTGNVKLSKSKNKYDDLIKLFIIDARELAVDLFDESRKEEFIHNIVSKSNEAVSSYINTALKELIDLGIINQP